jgi:FAD/FMN-containing dehydrogenase
MGTSFPPRSDVSSSSTGTPAKAPSSTTGADPIERLRAGMRGRVLTPTAPGYDEARAVWNAMIDKHPGLIARCTDAGDVAQAVRFARENRTVLAVRGGGHNIAGTAVCDGGLMIDLSPMRSVHVDPQTRTARVDGGATLGDFDREAQMHGLATPLGINSTTGVAGLTLGGGFGWLSRRYGLTIDNLLSADVVLASGDVVRASERENPDLFWAIRGGGGNFGVVTSFEFRLHEVGPDVLAGLVVHPLDAAGDVLRFYREFIARTPDDFVCWFVMRKAPPLPFLAPEWHGKEILALAICYAGKDMSEGVEIAAPLRAFGKPLADVVGPTPYAQWQQVLDPLLTPGARNYWKSVNVAKMSDAVIDTFISFARRIPDPQTEIACAQIGGATTRVPADATAYAHRDALWVPNIHGRWSDPAKDREVIGWARELFQALVPNASAGGYVNFLTEEEGDRVRAVYGDNFPRLQAIKAKYDPENLFQGNQNIAPA